MMTPNKNGDYIPWLPDKVEIVVEDKPSKTVCVDCGDTMEFYGQFFPENVEPLCAACMPKGYQVVCDDSNNSQQDREANRVIVDIIIPVEVTSVKGEQYQDLSRWARLCIWARGKLGLPVCDPRPQPKSMLAPSVVDILRQRAREENFARKILPPMPLTPTPPVPWWLGPLNFVLLQWVCYRLARKLDFMGQPTGWTMVGPWLPLTRWRNDMCKRCGSLDILCKRIGSLMVVFVAGGICMGNLLWLQYGSPVHYEGGWHKVAISVLVAIWMGGLAIKESK